MALSVEEALQRIIADAAPTAPELVPIERAAGRILAEPLAARLTQPPFDASAMDGYAVRTADVARLPSRLKVVGQAAAGHPFAGSIGPGEAARIFTGAPVPAGADAIVIQEHTTASDGVVEVREGQPDRAHIRRRGFDFRQSDELLAAGRRLGPREVTLAAAAGHGEVSVRRRPLVAILATGDELVPPGTRPGPGEIVSSNPLGVAALLDQAGAGTRLLGIARDSRDSLVRHIEAGRDADVLVTIGGASVGEHDLVGPVLESLGMTLAFWKIDMRPGKPMLHGRLGGQRVLGLPGNPVSALVCARVFLVPLVRALLGMPEQEAAAATAPLAEPVEANGPRQHYMRAMLERRSDGRRQVRLARSQDSSLLAPLAAADVLLVRPPGAPALPAGADVPVLLLDF
ncbi:MAG: molybdopterin molybdotransferase MoeA [Hyphomicrobiaceae bacterium]|nr:molybdopterin molybdotransferase MoeA [Hyphomicrobiaceae bacterium]